ncbi:MAG: hypothetical protein MUD10_04430 [Candidatus Pacebacteria bacterium]|jgi:hypothetical protein|nr:hypothetical protein [Candidatus Paceibacterota bacterium]
MTLALRLAMITLLIIGNALSQDNLWEASTINLTAINATAFLTVSDGKVVVFVAELTNGTFVAINASLAKHRYIGRASMREVIPEENPWRVTSYQRVRPS